jgi:predicted unusual protein kinase regulating ubiquinone biosynthesis (AarF/ABC1/UbiB family)
VDGGLYGKLSKKQIGAILEIAVSTQERSAEKIIAAIKDIGKFKNLDEARDGIKGVLEEHKSGGEAFKAILNFIVTSSDIELEDNMVVFVRSKELIEKVIRQLNHELAKLDTAQQFPRVDIDAIYQEVFAQAAFSKPELIKRWMNALSPSCDNLLENK